MSYSVGDRVDRLTILQKFSSQRFLVRCQCGSEPFEVWVASLRTGKRRTCKRCQNLEKTLEREIAAAKRAAEKNGLIFHEPSSRPRWEWEGDSEELAKTYGGSA